MKSNVTFCVLKRAKTMYRVALILLSIGVLKTKAQTEKFFTVNRRNINIDSFNHQVNDILNKAGVPGLSLAVIDHNKVVFSNAYGYSQLKRKTKVDEETTFEACSLSKTYLLFVIYKMVDEKLLDLDKPLYQYLPYPALEHDSRYRLITARMILNHSSGMEHQKWENNAEVLEIISYPGEKFNYSSEGYVYLGRVAEIILKQKDDQYLKEIVFKPLKLNRTFTRYTLMGLSPANHAVGYDASGKKVIRKSNPDHLVSGGIYTTAKDYATLVNTIFDKKTLSEGRFKDIISTNVNIDEGKGHLYWGGGFGIERLKGDTIIFHNGVHDGFRNWLHYSVLKQCGIVFFTNGSKGMSMLSKLNELTVNLDINAILDGLNE